MTNNTGKSTGTSTKCYSVEIKCLECFEVLATMPCEVESSRSIPCPFLANGKCTLVKDKDCGCGAKKTN